MPLGSLNGHARASPSNPIGVFLCDRCTMVWPRTAARRQFYWSGARLADSGLIVCTKCLDDPNEQYRALILPPDPIPFDNPRPDYSITPPATAGLSPPTSPLTQGFTGYQLGSVADQTWPITKAAVLAQVAALSGVPTPTLLDRSIIISSAFGSQSLVSTPTVFTRNFLLVYSPVSPTAGIDQNTAQIGSLTTLLFGPGFAWFQADALGLGQTYQFALTAAGVTAGMPLWAWESGQQSGQWLTDDLGHVITDDLGNPLYVE